MDTAQIKKLVRKAYDEYAAAVVKDIEGMGREAMHSGDDSPYNNVWEEVATQVQEGESILWEIYEETIRDYCSSLVSNLPKAEQIILWLYSEKGSEWTWSIDYDIAHGNGIDPQEDIEPFCLDDIADTLYRHVYALADAYPLPERIYYSEDEYEQDYADPLETIPQQKPHTDILTLPLFDE